MTYEELLAKTDEILDIYSGLQWQMASAVRATVELHKPLEFSRYCAYCVPKENYPCQTIKVIEKELTNGD